ncbi:MAG TPA: ketopantoate reductase family protein [bacterium]|nr:ketopantoate reductase family protein [bacterium]
MYGAGAVGGYYGLRLMQAGYDISFAARSKKLEIFRNEGLTLDSFATGKTEFKSLKLLDTETITDSADKFDLIILSVKSYDTQSNIEKLKKILAPCGKIICFQNGVENEELLLTAFDKNQIIGAAVFIAVALEHGNVVKHTGTDRIVFGYWDESINSAELDWLKKIFDSANLPNELSQNIKKDKWTKLVWNAAFNSLSVVLNSVVMDMVNNEHSAYLLRNTMFEVIEVAKSLNIIIDKKIIDDYLTIESNIGEFKTSMLQDFEKGRKLEYEYLNGAVIRAAKKNNISAPFNTFLYKILAFKECNKK